MLEKSLFDIEEARRISSRYWTSVSNILTMYMMKACMVSTFVVLRRFALESMNSVISRSLSTSKCFDMSEKDAAASPDRLTAAENMAAKRMA